MFDPLLYSLNAGEIARFVTKRSSSHARIRRVYTREHQAIGVVLEVARSCAFRLATHARRNTIETRTQSGGG